MPFCAYDVKAHFNLLIEAIMARDVMMCINSVIVWAKVPFRAVNLLHNELPVTEVNTLVQFAD